MDLQNHSTDQGLPPAVAETFQSTRDPDREIHCALGLQVADKHRLISDSPIPASIESQRAAAGTSTRRFKPLLIAAGSFNLLAIPVLRAAENDSGAMLFFAPIVIGYFVGQIGAMALWLVWGDGPFLWRLAIHWAIGLALIASALVGLALATADMQHYPPFAIYELLSVVCILPIVSLAIQLLHWPLRTHFHWRLAPEMPMSQASKQSSLSILDIIVGTTVVALSLALIRLTPIPGAASYMWIRAAVTAVFFSALSLIVLLPAMIFVLRFNQLQLGLAAFGIYLAVCIFALIFVSAITVRSPPPSEAVFALIVGVASGAATSASPLLVWRSAGYRLVWSRETGPSPTH